MQRLLNRLNQRQGFLVSAVFHLVVITLLASGPPRPRVPDKQQAPLAAEKRVFLPPPAMLRQLLPAVPTPPRRPQPRAEARAPEPPKDKLKDRISVGGPSAEQAKGPLVLRKEDDLTAVPKGRPNATPSAPPATAPPEAAVARAGAQPEVPGAPGLRVPPGLGNVPTGDGGSRARPGTEGPSIASSLRDLERRLETEGPRGLPSGTGQQVGPLKFDPEGADFTGWVNHFKNEVYRNWIVPTPALMGFRGHVDIEFTVERDGTMTNLRILKSSGTPALDRAAQNALLGSRLLALPADFGPPRVTMEVTFLYNESPHGS